MHNDGNDDDMSWVRRPRSSFREAFSRGSQTTTDSCDDDYLPDQESQRSSEESRPVTASANNVRRASFLLGGLKAIYSPQVVAEEPASSIQPEVRSPPSNSNPWNIYYRKEVLPELDRVLLCREVHDLKCRSMIDKIRKKTLRIFFFCWRQSNLAYLQKHLLKSVEDSSGVFKQRRSSIVKVWSHIAVGLTSQKEIFEQRRGGMELASETLAQRILHKNGTAESISTSTIDEEAGLLLSSKFGLDIWLSGYYKITYFRLWRESIDLPVIFFNKNRCRAVISCWRAQSKAAIEVSGQALTIDYSRSRYEEAKSFHRLKIIDAVLKRWRARMRILSDFACFCKNLWQSIQEVHKESKRNAFLQWAAVAEVNNTYCRLPFRRWRALTFNQKHCSRIQNRLLSVYLRSKYHRRLYTSFRLWKQQSRYSKVTALYTRNELASELLQQKQNCKQLTLSMDAVNSKLESYDQLQMQVKCLEGRLHESEKLKSVAEQDVFVKCVSGGNISCPSQFRESLATLCPILMHDKNIL